MPTREEFKKFVDALPENYLEQTNETQGYLEHIVDVATVEVLIYDHKALEDYSMAVCGALASLGGGFLTCFESFHDFPSGNSGDDVIAVVSKEPIDRELGEIIADLVCNLGAEIPERPERKKGGSRFLPSGREISFSVLDEIADSIVTLYAEVGFEDFNDAVVSTMESLQEDTWEGIGSVLTFQEAEDAVGIVKEIARKFAHELGASYGRLGEKYLGRW